MDQMTRQTETRDVRLERNTGKRIVGILFGVVEIILSLRFAFKLLGANPENGFIKLIYNITQFVVGLFENIFAEVTLSEATGAVFEPAALIAIIIVALIAWLVLTLMTPHKSKRVEKTESTKATESENQPIQNLNQQNRK